jgi:hypothetical protein
VSQPVVALGPPSFELFRLVSGFADQDRYEGDDEEGRVEVGYEVRFAVGVVREDRLADVISLRSRKCFFRDFLHWPGSWRQSRGKQSRTRAASPPNASTLPNSKPSHSNRVHLDLG